MSDKPITKIDDSQSWISSLQHFTTYNSIDPLAFKSRNSKTNQIQYVIASTFDGWLAIRQIDVSNIKWIKLYNMKMTLPVVRTFIQFDANFLPLGLVVAYMDGSLEYSPWSQIKQSYQIQLSAGKSRSISYTLPQAVKKSQRIAYINPILDSESSLKDKLFLETICFLHKKNDYIYALNFSGELKMFKVDKNTRRLQLIQMIEFESRVVCAEHLIGCESQNDDRIVVAICFEQVETPFVFQISPQITKEKIFKNIEAIFQASSVDGQIINNSNIKQIIYDPTSQSIITCTQNNQIGIYSFQQQQSERKKLFIRCNLQRIFVIEQENKTQHVNDISVLDGVAVIMCKNSFRLYDILEESITRKGQKLKEEIQLCKMVLTKTDKGLPLFVAKKKFNYWERQTKKSTTLHLFHGK